MSRLMQVDPMMWPAMEQEWERQVRMGLHPERIVPLFMPPSPEYSPFILYTILEQPPDTKVTTCPPKPPETPTQCS